MDCPWSSRHCLALSPQALVRSPPVFYFSFLFHLFSSFPLYSVLPLYVGLHVLAVYFLHSFECDICASPTVEDV